MCLLSQSNCLNLSQSLAIISILRLHAIHINHALIHSLCASDFATVKRRFRLSNEDEYQLSCAELAGGRVFCHPQCEIQENTGNGSLRTSQKFSKDTSPHVWNSNTEHKVDNTTWYKPASYDGVGNPTCTHFQGHKLLPLCYPGWFITGEPVNTYWKIIPYYFELVKGSDQEKLRYYNTLRVWAKQHVPENYVNNATLHSYNFSKLYKVLVLTAPFRNNSTQWYEAVQLGGAKDIQVRTFDSTSGGNTKSFGLAVTPFRLRERHCS